MKKKLENFRLTKSQTQKITGGRGGCRSYRRTYVGDDWWQDDVIMDDCDSIDIEVEG